MKAKLKQEEFFEDAAACCMRRMKAGSIVSGELIRKNFARTEIEKKVFIFETPKGKLIFEEWEPGSFEKVFEIL